MWIILDQFLIFQGEVKIILRKMACGIKTLQSIKKNPDNKKPSTIIENFSHKPSAPTSKTIKLFDIQSNNIP